MNRPKFILQEDNKKENNKDAKTASKVGKILGRYGEAVHIQLDKITLATICPFPRQLATVFVVSIPKTMRLTSLPLTQSAHVKLCWTLSK